MLASKIRKALGKHLLNEPQRFRTLLFCSADHRGNLEGESKVSKEAAERRGGERRWEGEGREAERVQSSCQGLWAPVPSPFSHVAWGAVPLLGDTFRHSHGKASTSRISECDCALKT